MDVSALFLDLSIYIYSMYSSCKYAYELAQKLSRKEKVSMSSTKPVLQRKAYLYKRVRTYSIRGVFRIKCAGQNNFNTNHFISSAISGLFKARSLLIRTYHSQWSIYHQKAAPDSFLQLIRATPSTFFMRPPWNSERPAGFDFASLKQKKVRCSHIGK
jgi:hypothetical protein